MAKVKRKATVKKTATKKTGQSRVIRTIYGIEREFVLIGGGGFLLIVLGMMIFF